MGPSIQHMCRPLTHPPLPSLYITYLFTMADPPPPIVHTCYMEGTMLYESTTRENLPEGKFYYIFTATTEPCHCRGVGQVWIWLAFHRNKILALISLHNIPEGHLRLSLVTFFHNLLEFNMLVRGFLADINTQLSQIWA